MSDNTKLAERAVLDDARAAALERRVAALEKQNKLLSDQTEFYYWRLIRSDENLRDIIHKIGGLPEAEQNTRGVFQYKWSALNDGIYTLENPQHRAEIKTVVQRWTGMSEEWFAGKKVLDAGCGDGRLSYGLASMGAAVVSADQSTEGVQRTVRYCADFPGHRGIIWNLLNPYPIDEQFDFVLSFGVVHCTGDTLKAVTHLTEVVRPGGHIALMVYGYPRFDKPGEWVNMNHYDRIRQAIRHMDYESARAYVAEQIKIHDLKGDVRGWYDAVAPRVEDHYTYEQMAMMLRDLGYTDIFRISPEIRNICIRATKPA